MTRQTPKPHLGFFLLACMGCSEEPTARSQVVPVGGGSMQPILPDNGGMPAGGATAVPGGGQGAVSEGTGGSAGMAAPAAPDGGSTGGVPIVAMRSSWSSFGGDLEHSRFSPNESMISVSNAKELKTAFEIAAPGVTATPALYQGVIYWADWGGIVHATDLVEQTELWSVDKSAMKGGYTGSPAVTQTTVYVANRNGLLSALDRETGEVQWEYTLDAGAHTHIWSSPVVAEEDNVLVIGVGGYGTRDNSIALPRSQLESFRGFVQILDSQTGDPLWRIEVSPAPNGAGVAVWSSAAIDTKLKRAYIGTGNNYYRPVSPLSDSLLAIDYTTGEVAWSEQFTQNDAWNYGQLLSGGVDGDVGAAPNLFTIDGRDVVGVGEKTGSYHVHDRDTGVEVWSKTLTRGGFQGGVMAPAAYHDGVIYVTSNNDTASSTVFALRAQDGEELWSKRLTDPTFGGPALGNGVLYVGDQAGNVWALDASNGDELWETRLPGGRGGGFSLVDGMLFTGYGYHFSESRREPLKGGLVGFSLTGTVMPPTPVSTSDCMDDAVLTSAPTFTNVYQGVLCPLGCTKVCHASASEGGLNLEGKAIAYQGVVNVAASGPPCSGRGTLVVPGDPSRSLLHSKLTLMPECGLAMPPSGNAASSPVTPAMLDAVRAWIAAGAPND